MYPGVWRHGDWIEITDARHGDHLRPLGLDDQPRRHPHGHQRDLPRGAGARRGHRRAGGGRPARGRGELDAAVRGAARGRGARRRPEAGDRRQVREDCSPRHVPDEVFAVAEVPRTLSGKVLEVPVKQILSGTPPEQAASRDSLARTPVAGLLHRDGSRGRVGHRAISAHHHRSGPSAISVHFSQIGYRQAVHWRP